MRNSAKNARKDSLLALDRARRKGLNVTHLVNIYEGSSGRVRFHGVRKELVEMQAAALRLKLVQTSTHPETFVQALGKALTELGQEAVDGTMFGNIHLADIRASAIGFEHVEPLWGDPPATLIREFVALGHRARIVSVYLTCGRREWLGREFTDEFIAELEQSASADVCGERAPERSPDCFRSPA